MKSLLETVHIYWSRVTCLLVITMVALVPLCLMKDLDALAPFSALGVASVGVAMIAMIIRCFDGTYQPGGVYYDYIASEYQPLFGHETHQWSLMILPYVCMIFQSWVMHYNTPRFYMELKDASIPRFAEAVGCSFGLSVAMYIVISAAGFWTFGGNSSSYILNSYSPNDPLATASRLGVFFSTLLIYPLAFIGVRDGCLDVFQVPDHLQTTRNLNAFSLLLLTILTIGAVLFHDLGLINAVGGGALATFLCFVFPALMYRRAVKLFPDKTKNEQQEVMLAVILMAIGVILGLVGVWQSIKDAVDDSDSE
jgi:amino acid permease